MNALPEFAIALDDPARPAVRALLEAHLDDMRATSPPESVHALDVEALRGPGIDFWTLSIDGVLAGCSALRVLTGEHGEIKSMRTVASQRGRGVAGALVRHLLTEARVRGIKRLSLETGSQDFFASARRLYARHGFEVCGPFGDYVLDPNSVFMTRAL